MALPKDNVENFRSKSIHKKSARWQSGVRLIIIAVSFLVVGIILFTVSFSFEDDYRDLGLIAPFLYLISNIIFIISMFRKVDGYKKIMSKKKLLGIMFLAFFAFFSIPGIVYHGVYSAYYPEQYAERELKDEYKREQIRISQQIQEEQKEIENRKIQAEKIQQKELDEYESIVTETGRLKYRPYWMVGDKNDEMEMNGEIIKSKECADLVTLIAEVESGTSLQTIIHKQWVETCIRFR